ncbi:MAG: hypothetical protein M3542_13345 [Acidobacteriota bacterium]|nr:hypothetical protein [Acidobacteriota bacterium]MDQ5870814.1 hypothetical protein [Acidobacteriota bacterium]
MATFQTTEPRLHPIVTLDYRVRVIAMLVMGLIPLFHFNGRPPMPALAAMAFTGLVWPHVAYLLARSARDSGNVAATIAWLLSKIEGLLQKRNPA